MSDLFNDFDDVASEAPETERTCSTSQKRGQKGKPAYRSALAV